jgi:hypothetical protein
MMRARVVPGWVVVGPYTEHDVKRVRIGCQPTSSSDAPEYVPAFLDWVDGERVAKVRPPEFRGRYRVHVAWPRADGVDVVSVGDIVIP